MGSRIEAGITVEGSLRGDGDLTVAGRLRGALTLAGRLVVEEGGAVEADVEAGSIVVAGLLAGSATAHEDVRVLPGGRMEARVRAARLHVADGAVFQGELQAAPTSGRAFVARADGPSARRTLQATGEVVPGPAARPVRAFAAPPARSAAPEPPPPSTPTRRALPPRGGEAPRMPALPRARGPMNRRSEGP